MALLHDGVTILNLDASYLPQEHLREYPHEWVDLLDIPNTNRYCETASFAKINRRLQRRCKRGITFIGSGNYHYVSYLLLSEIEEQFTLVLFDHHTDMLPEPSTSLVSCGSWVTHAITRLPKLQKVVIIGTRSNQLNLIPPSMSSKAVVLPGNSLLSSDDLTTRVLQAIETDAVYISIDKDVLAPTEAITNWDQGSMQLDELLQILSHMIARKKVYGVDICGELPVSPVELFQPFCLAAIQKNQFANRKILDQLHQQKRGVS